MRQRAPEYLGRRRIASTGAGARAVSEVGEGEAIPVIKMMAREQPTEGVSQELVWHCVLAAVVAVGDEKRTMRQTRTMTVILICTHRVSCLPPPSTSRPRRWILGGAPLRRTKPSSLRLGFRRSSAALRAAARWRRGTAPMSAPMRPVAAQAGNGRGSIVGAWTAGGWTACSIEECGRCEREPGQTIGGGGSAASSWLRRGDNSAGCPVLL